MNPSRVWKTLNMHGPMTAREVAAQWAAVPPSRVTDWSIQRVNIALDILDEYGFVSPKAAEDDTVDELTRWTTRPLPANTTERRAILKTMEKQWRELRPPKPESVSPE